MNNSIIDIIFNNKNDIEYLKALNLKAALYVKSDNLRCPCIEADYEGYERVTITNFNNIKFPEFKEDKKLHIVAQAIIYNNEIISFKHTHAPIYTFNSGDIISISF